MNLLIEELKAPHTVRERAIRRRDDLATARSARSRERGCHPFVERVSLLLVAAGTRLNAWAAPAHRRVRLDQAAHSRAAATPRWRSRVA